MAQSHNLAVLAEQAYERHGDYESVWFEGEWYRSGALFERALRVAAGLRDERLHVAEQVEDAHQPVVADDPAAQPVEQVQPAALVAQLGDQALAALAAPVYAFVATYVLLKLIGLVTPLRGPEHDEALGMDVIHHGEEAYASGEGAILVTPEAGVEDEVLVA